MPPFQYNPELFWDAEPGHSKATIKPGPNNPVGVVWIDINKPHYGIHGTPEPGTVGTPINCTLHIVDDDGADARAARTHRAVLRARPARAWA